MSRAALLLRSRPLTVEAMRVEPDDLGDVALWCGGVVLPGRGIGLYTDTGDFAHANIGGYIIKGPFGEFYPAPERVVFSKYEAVIPVVAE